MRRWAANYIFREQIYLSQTQTLKEVFQPFSFAEIYS